ncbi:mucin-12 isoform X2 [Hermetia illucens]|uniref:mucin-12 isoform X2 n=1 Tax=Hermetia illucens TaxID=343691 RepID=UPI0018CC0204|nr:mucin-12 isoform X2 [Hermetia illucens]
MSNQEQSAMSGNTTEKNVQQITVQKTSGTATFPIDLAPAKIAHVKPSGDTLKVASVQGTAQQATPTYRTISTGQPSQVRVVMPNATIMPQSMIPKMDGAATAQAVRAQITAVPNRTLSQASITVTRPATQAFLPRAGTTNIQQRLVTPIRTPTPPNVAGFSGNFVRGTTVARSSSSPATTVISPTTATWMAASGGSPIQFIRNINPQRQRLVPTSTGGAGVVAVGQAATLASGQVQSQQAQSQGNIQTTTSQPAQQTFVATLSTVLQPRQQTATLVYTNVSSSQAQQYNPTGSTQQRYAVAAATIAGGQRQVRPIQLSNRALSSSKIVLAPTLNTGATVTNLQTRTSTGNVNLPTAARIIQLQQQQPGTGGQQILGAGRIPNNLMLQPIIMSSGGGKIASGIRPQTTISKVQSSVTITQLGLGKLPAGQTGVTPTVTATNLQGATITPSSATNVVASVTAGAVAQSPQAQQAVQQQPAQQQQQTQQSQQQAQQSQQGSSVPNPAPQSITQIVNVNQSSGQIIAQNVNVASSATVVPLAIPSRTPNVITGTIKVATAAITVPPVAKVIPQQQQQQPQQSQQHHQQSQGTHLSSQSASGQQSSDNSTSVQPHHQPTSVYIHTRPPSSGNASGATGISSAFIQQPSGFYYESVPASSVTVSTGVLSLTTTTVTSSISTSQAVTSTSLASALATSIAYNPTSTYTVVPATSRAIGQVQIPASSTAGQPQTISQIQAVPLRFTSQHLQEQAVPISSQPAGLSQQTNQPLQQQHPQIITMSQPQHSQAGQQVQQTHMLIPMQTIKLPAAAVVAPSPPRPTATAATLSTINSAFLRKRDNEGSPIRAAKNLAPTLLSMAPAQVSNLIAERVKDRDRERPTSPQSRPGSSGGSTTVSANSSPGVDQQMSEEMNSMTPMNVRVSNESHFSPINDMYPNHQNSVGQGPPRQLPVQPQHVQHQPSSGCSNGTLEATPKKKPRRSIENPPVPQHQQSLGQHHPNNQQLQNNTASNQQLPSQQSQQQVGPHEGFKPTNNNNASVIASSNKENAKPTEIIIKKPRTCNLLDGYKQNWKAANNHFQRYSDVKPREERPPTVMDLANQAHVVQKINGWKIYHLSAQMEDLCEIESQVFDKLSDMLKQLESHGQSQDTDRVNDLIKGNMQRSKIIVDGVNEARSQIMKIFDHKSHVSDIIHRCASKRNFKKREKT